MLVSYRNFSWKIRQTARFTCIIAQNQVDLTTTFLIAISLRQTALFITYFSVFFISGKRRFNIKLWKTFTDCFNCLPIAAIVDEKIFCCHGGLSPDLQSMEQIRRIMRPTDVPDTGKNFNFTKNRQKSQKAIWSILIQKFVRTKYFWNTIYDYSWLEVCNYVYCNLRKCKSCTSKALCYSLCARIRSYLSCFCCGLKIVTNTEKNSKLFLSTS